MVLHFFFPASVIVCFTSGVGLFDLDIHFCFRILKWLLILTVLEQEMAVSDVVGERRGSNCHTLHRSIFTYVNERGVDVIRIGNAGQRFQYHSIIVV